MNVFSKIQNFEIPLSILVTPHSSLAQWDNLFKEETDIKYFIVDSDDTIDLINIYEYQVLIVSDLFFDKVCLLFQGFSVSRIIFDDLLHLEIKDINYTQGNGLSSYVTNTDPGLFGNLRASFTWFVSSEPHACLQKYRKYRLPFALLINQIFSFPYPGLVFRNEDSTLEQSLSVILPEMEFDFKCVYLQKIEEINIQKEIENILSIQNSNQIYKHLFTIFIQHLHIKIIPIENIYQNLSQDKIKTIKDNYETLLDPVTYDKILHPILLPCCHQIFDLLSIAKCLSSNMRCPFCRKETKWSDIIGIKRTDTNIELNQDIWDIIDNINLDQYNVFYIPSLCKNVSIHKESRLKIHLFIRELTKRYKCFVFSGKSNSKKVFHDFKKEKGILIIGKPIESNLHLSYVDHIFVLHPKEYKCNHQNVWFTNYFKKYYSKNISHESSPQIDSIDHNNLKDKCILTCSVSTECCQQEKTLLQLNRSLIMLTDHELGNFCIGKQNKLNISCITFL
jgi:hypothetical protein